MRRLFCILILLCSIAGTSAQISFSPTFEKHWNKTFRAGGMSFDIPVVDLNADGIPDVVMHGDTATTIFFSHPHDIAYQFSKKTIYRNIELGGYRSVVANDFDADGLTDLAVPIVHIANSGILFFRHVLNGTTHEFLPFDSLTPAFMFGQMITSDIDGDGKTDLIITSTSTNNIAIYRNTSTAGNISFAELSLVDAHMQTSFIGAGDLDGDGKPDLALASDAHTNISILRNQSTPGNIQFQQSTMNTSDPAAFITIADLDKNGKPEIISAGAISNLTIYPNISSVSNILFGTAVSMGLQFQSRDLNFHYATAADMDNDGDLDLILGVGDYQIMAYSGYTVTLENTGSNGNITFGNPISTQTNYVQGIGVGDFRNSGNQDVFVYGTRDSDGSLFLIENRQGQFVNLELCPPISSGTIAAERSGSNYRWQESTDGVSYSYINASANFQNETTSVLNYTNLPSTYNAHFFRCEVDGESAHALVFKIVFVNHFVNTSGAAIPFSNPDKWSCHTIPDENTNVIVDAGEVNISQNITIYSLIIGEDAGVHIEPGVILNVLH